MKLVFVLMAYLVTLAGDQAPSGLSLYGDGYVVGQTATHWIVEPRFHRIAPTGSDTLGFKLPSLKLPSMPRFSMPRISIPKISAPKISMPKISAPKVTMPKIAAPAIKAPSIPLKINLPNIKLPSLNTGKAVDPLASVRQLLQTPMDLAAQSVDTLSSLANIGPQVISQGLDTVQSVAEAAPMVAQALPAMATDLAMAPLSAFSSPPSSYSSPVSMLDPYAQSYPSSEYGVTPPLMETGSVDPESDKRKKLMMVAAGVAALGIAAFALTQNKSRRAK